MSTTGDDDGASVFGRIWRENAWGSAESVSGPGSTLEQTAAIRAGLPDLWRELGVRHLLDVPCGDFHWMSRIDLTGIAYMGGDIAPQVVRQAQDRHGGPGRTFMTLDLVGDSLPQADLILIRDCLVHLPLDLARRALRNGAGAAPWVMTTTFPGAARNKEIALGGWRRLDLCRSPFGLPQPVRLINEGMQSPRNRMKSLGLWRSEAIIAALEGEDRP